MDDAIASHFLLHQTEGEHLNMPVGVRQITQSLVHSFIWFSVLHRVEGREEHLTGLTRTQINTLILTHKGNSKSPDSE